jgi:hypothetical protein
MPGTPAGPPSIFPGQAHNDGQESLALWLAGRPLVTTLLRQLGFRTPATGSEFQDVSNYSAEPIWMGIGATRTAAPVQGDAVAVGVG